MVSDVLLLSYLDKICLSLTDEAGQASVYLYSEARLYKGASLVPVSQSTTTHSTGNIYVGIGPNFFLQDFKTKIMYNFVKFVAT